MQSWNWLHVILITDSYCTGPSGSQATARTKPAEAVKPKPAEKAAPLAKAEPTRKRQKSERPAGKYGLLDDSNSDESDQDNNGKVMDSLQPSQGKPGAKKQSNGSSFDFGGERPLEQGALLTKSLQNSQLLPTKPTFSFLTASAPPGSAANGVSKVEIGDRTPNGLSPEAAQQSNEEAVEAASIQLPSEASDEEEAKPNEVRPGFGTFRPHEHYRYIVYSPFLRQKFDSL